MRVLLLCHSFNSLTQRLYLDLRERGCVVSVEFDIADAVSEEAVALFRPDLIVAPYLRRAIPEAIWRAHVCLVVHPGIVGDRGPSALDWVIQEGQEQTWGVTVLQAEAQMDAGPVWASEEFPLRAATKSSLYRNEVTAAASRALHSAIERFCAGARPTSLAQAPGRGRARALLVQAQRSIAWQVDDSATVLRKIRAADGFPGVADTLFGEACHVYDAWPETHLPAEFADALPGAVVARRETALLRKTVDGAVWIGQVKRDQATLPLKLPATLAFGAELPPLPELALRDWWRTPGTWQDIAYEEEENGAVGVLHFEFHNGAMGTAQCQRLQQALVWAQGRPTRVLVLTGGADFWSNGIHLHLIEAAESPADESWRNIEAMDDLAAVLINNDRQLSIAALGGNAGAGGVFLARAADLVWARQDVLLNPHYKNMGNLYGSEYWTYLLPPRVGAAGADAIMQQRQPMRAQAAQACGLIDACIAVERAGFLQAVRQRAAQLADPDDWSLRLQVKRQRRAADEAAKPLATYRAEELAQMRRNFYGFDPSYHVARYHFVHRTPQAWTPRHLARHRDLDWEIPTP